MIVEGRRGHLGHLVPELSRRPTKAGRVSDERRFERPPGTVILAAGDPVAGTISVPGSKSQTNRVFILSALATGVSRIDGAMVADDSHHMVEALRALGIVIEQLDAAGESWRIVGCGGEFPGTEPVTLNAGLAGTVMRFVSAAATLAPHVTTVTGRTPLLARPVGELLAALSSVGADVSGSGEANGFPPVTIRPRRPIGGRVSVDASKSSQFASALAAVSPYFTEGLDLEVVGLEASGYFDLTVEMMRRRGAELERTATGLKVAPGGYTALDDRVPGDISSASHLLTLAAATGGQVRVENLAGADLQPDMQVLDTLAAFGCDVAVGADGSVTVTGPERLTPVTVDLSETPDQLPNIAVLAALAPGRSIIRGVGITRFHETDRIQAVERELAKVGVTAKSVDGDVYIDGGNAQPGATLTTYHDHRLGMAFASLGLAVGDVVINEADCVDKTYPQFWDAVEQLGGRVSRA
jgi:3-phosphoshikimate 1-carboxyvinyltransferase